MHRQAHTHTDLKMYDRYSQYTLSGLACSGATAAATAATAPSSPRAAAPPLGAASGGGACCALPDSTTCRAHV